jgi:16S rRNA processing protein RimM
MKRSNLISVGRLTGVFGVKGWVKVKSSTEPEDGILQYSPWWLKTRHGVKPVEIDDHQLHSNGLVVHIKGVDDRDQAAAYTLVDVAVERSQLADLDEGDYYWHQLIGLNVYSEYEGSNVNLGVVDKLLETGANDVLAVKPSDDSIDDRERLVPYVLDLYIKDVDIENEQIRVDWDPEF